MARSTMRRSFALIPLIFVSLSAAWPFALHLRDPTPTKLVKVIARFPAAEEPAVTTPPDTAFPSATDGETIVTTFTPEYYTETTAILTAASDAPGPVNTSEPPSPSDVEIQMPVKLNSPEDARQFPLGGNRGARIGLGQYNIFDQPVGTAAPLAMFERRDNHPVDRQGVVNMDDQPVSTNKFWGNLVLGNGNLGVYAQPYTVWVNKDEGLWGLAVSHIDPDQIVSGPDPNGNPVQYYYNPVNINSLTLTAAEFNLANSSMTTEALGQHSALLKLWGDKSEYPNSKFMTVPIVQGMGFVTGQYENLIPKIQSGVRVRNLSYAGILPSGVQKWKVSLMDGKEWRIYASGTSANKTISFALANDGTIQAPSFWSGTIQITKLADYAAETAIDSAAGTVCSDMTLSGSVSGTTGTYTFTFATSGKSISSCCLMYALPHQVASFDATTKAKVIGHQLKSTTKGMMQAVVSRSWTLVETNLPVCVGWLPGSYRDWTPRQLAAMKDAITSEISYDVIGASNIESQYFAGKYLGKYAQILLVAAEVLNDMDKVKAGLPNLLFALNRFASNKQIFPLVYDTKWKGLVSSSWWVTGDPNQDFGNAYYNDHHFHYGYFIYAAAVVVHLEKLVNNGASPWLDANRAYVMDLIRDTANPSTKDPHFPVHRAFDFFNGHSWATGLYPRTDGKDQESTSEDYNFAYGLKLWGNVIGDAVIEARANLQLAILKRSVNAYFLMDDQNQNQPANFIKNKVTGILFENKADHTTWFGNNIEFIQGIHMLPLTPVSPYVRNPTFCYEEWQQWFDNRTENINSGWRGVLWANVALFDPNASFDFFDNPSFPNGWLDDGASRTWYLAFAAGLGGGRY